MIFEVLQNGKPIMKTEDERCLYSRQTLLSMKDAGLTFRMDGKPFTVRGKKEGAK